MRRRIELIEEEAFENGALDFANGRHQSNAALQFSIAISLKRIADRLEDMTGPEFEQLARLAGRAFEQGRGEQ